MATVIFDFDSTLIGCESLEEILRPKLSADLFLRLEEITNRGMDGDIPFMNSFSERLKLASLTRDDFMAFGRQAEDFLVPGMKELVQKIKGDVWILSGAVRESMLPLAKILGIPEGRVIGVELEWGSGGERVGMGAFTTKWQAAELYKDAWTKPTVAIGDSVTDWELHAHGLVDHFIPFTQIARRPGVLKKGLHEARDMEELKRQLKTYL